MVEQYGDLKQAESAIGTGPFLLERYEPNVKTVFKRNPDYFRTPEHASSVHERQRDKRTRRARSAEK